jgi:hypothetical protein
MIPMHPYLISQLAAEHRADMIADAGRQRLARQARTACQTAVRTATTRPLRPLRPLRLAARLRAMVTA